jgi:hypothetical protein
MSFVSFATIFLLRTHRTSRFGLGRPSDAPLSCDGRIPTSGRAIPLPIPKCKIFAPGRSLDLKPSGFIAFRDGGGIQIIRILHGKRDVKGILETEK